MRLYDEHETEMCNALAQDLRKSRQESIINEVELLRNDLRNLLMNLNEYTKPEKVRIKLQKLQFESICDAKKINKIVILLLLIAARKNIRQFIGRCAHL